MTGPSIKTPEPIQAKEPKQERVISKSTPIETSPMARPIDVYEQEEGKPYVTEYFDIKVPYSYEVLEDTERLDLIDEYVKGTITSEDKKSNTDTYKNVLDSLKKKLEIDEDTEPEQIIERLSGFVKAFNHIKEMKEKKTRSEILDIMYIIAKNKDFDSSQLALLIEEGYLKEIGGWNAISR